MTSPAAAIRDAARRVDAATPVHRDRAVDALRAAAILGVVLGHWLVTALVADGRTLRTASPLQHMPWLAPVSWAFQTLAVFFLVGGHVATLSYGSARARGIPYHRWLRARMARLFAPVAAVLTLWTVVAVALALSGTEYATLRTLVKLALSPMWFLLVFAALTAATPLLTRLHPLWPLAVVLHVDLLRFGLGAPEGIGLLNVAAGWLVPYTLGAAWTRGELERRRSGWFLLLAGSAATAALVARAGYPASMVGVPGAGVSNLDPPTLAVVTFGLAQCGLALLLRDRLRRAMRRPVAWAAVALVNLWAMTVFLWHQTALMATTATGLLAGPLPGLHTVPDGLGWVAARLLWLPVFALALLLCWAAFRHGERGGGGRRGRSRVVRAHRPATEDVRHV
ncbi:MULTISPECIES: acyltransferase family protein [unclassified Streptomyces]|uniref:acyltransferase family protein n=1 Tax=unclassified Streptomyces TaxID=2593676 RepID=UPI000F7004CA|nr:MULTISPECIES: acyltransferase [unclassified Streptomyces]AZM61024.1 acyltransferase [Streptomyces sp. WAC 01438]RSM97764.1 acyltransferase [Streptomyces sp. WAC 01420]